jgi:hypothetical protein
LHIQFTDFHYNPRERDKHRHTDTHTNKKIKCGEHTSTCAHTRAPHNTVLANQPKKTSHKTHTRRYLRSRDEREREREREHTHTHTQRDLKEGKSANLELGREKIKEGKSRLNILISGH